MNYDVQCPVTGQLVVIWWRHWVLLDMTSCTMNTRCEIIWRTWGTEYICNTHRHEFHVIQILGYIADLTPLAAENGFTWSWPPSSTWFLGPTWVSSLNDILISSAVSTGLTLLHKPAKSYALQCFSMGRTTRKIAHSLGGDLDPT